MEIILAYARRPRLVKPPPPEKQTRQFRWIGWGLFGAAVAGMLAGCWLVRRVPYGQDELFMMLPVCLVMALVGGTMLLRWGLRVWCYAESWRDRLGLLRPAIGVWLVIGVSCILALAGIPFRVAFAVSRPALERAVARVRVDPGKEPFGGEVGILPVEGLDVEGPVGIVRFRESITDWRVPVSLQWGPEAAIRGMAGGRPYEALGHDWYVVQDERPW